MPVAALSPEQAADAILAAWTPLAEIVWVTFAFVLGTCAGSFLNVVIGRLPLEKSLLWPNSRCLTCLHPLNLADNLPIIGWLRRRGRCRYCGAKFSSRYLWVELATGIGFALIFYLDVLANWHQIPFMDQARNQFRVDGVPPWQAVVFFLHHAVLFSFLLAAALCDWDRREIPLSLTVTGTVIGLAAATCFPWPFPNDAALAAKFQDPIVVGGIGAAEELGIRTDPGRPATNGSPARPLPVAGLGPGAALAVGTPLGARAGHRAGRRRGRDGVVATGEVHLRKGSWQRSPRHGRRGPDDDGRGIHGLAARRRGVSSSARL